MAICLCPQIYGHRMPVGKPLDEKRGRPVRKPAEVAKCWPQLTHDNIISWGENKVLIYGCDTSGHVPRFWSNQPLIPLNQHISHWYIPIISSYTYCPHTGRLPTLPLWERQGAESRTIPSAPNCHSPISMRSDLKDPWLSSRLWNAPRRVSGYLVTRPGKR